MVAGNAGSNPSTSNNSGAGVATTSTNSPPVQREPEASEYQRYGIGRDSPGLTESVSDYVVAWNSTSGNFSGRNLDKHVPYT
ncbi:hypothetical protein FS842_002302 [Serendipita sp. 407]|nr:hypothetical protein FS842_002302 [Serendipita sp. 407]